MSAPSQSRIVRGAASPLSLVLWVARSLSRHWDLLWQMVTTDLRGRYVGSTLGLFWTVIHPLVLILVYTVVFSRVMGARLAGSSDPYAYGIYLCSGLFPWLAFQEVVTRATTIFPDNAGLVRKVAFPKVILYGFITLTGAINLGLALAIFLAAIALTGHSLHATLAIWLPLIILQLAFGLGVGMVFSVFHVFVRDTAQLVAVGFQLLFWMTPIVYLEDLLPAWLQRLEVLNPLYLFTRTHHDVVVYGRVPSLARLAVLLFMTAGSLALGTVVYRRFRSEILDEL
jgi:homopolymeric O-antigen transport system permease protein